MSPNVNPANAVTASRFLTLPPFLYYVDRGDYQLATLMAMACGFLDLIDGGVARLFNCQTAFGEVFDAIADAICYAFCLTVLAAYHWVPWPPVAAIWVLGLLNSGMRFQYARRLGRAANYKSAAMERVVGFASFLVGFGATGYEVTYYYYTCVAVMAVVLLHDIKRMLVDPVPVSP